MYQPGQYHRRAGEVGAPSRGFTLIELLVVVAIIALLISILLPSLSRARAQTRQVVCGTQLKQFGTAFQLYFNDNDDKLFPYVSRALGYRWLRPYLNKVDQIMLCTDTRPMTNAQKDDVLWHGAPPNSRTAWCWAAPGAPYPPVDNPPDDELYGEGSYTFNGWLFDPSIEPFYGVAYYDRALEGMLEPAHPYHYKRLSRVGGPGRVPLMMDGFEMVIYAVNQEGSSGEYYFEWPNTVLTSDLRTPRDSLRQDGGRSVFTTPWPQQLFRAMPDRHLNFRNNMSYMDGHVEKVEPKKMLDLMWGPKFQRGEHARRPIDWPI